MLGLPLGLGRGTRLRPLNLNIVTNAIVTENLQAHYNTEDRSTLIGTAPAITGLSDKTANGYDATLTSNWAQLTHADKGNHMLRVAYDASSKLDTGTGTFGDTSLFADAGDAFTIFCVGTYNGNGTILSKTSSAFGNKQLLCTYESGEIKVGVRGGTTTTFVTGVSDTLTAIALHWDGSAFTASYIKDGESTWTDTTITVGAQSAEAVNLIFGSHTAGASFQIEGEYGEIMIYDAALTSEQMDQMATYIAANWTNKQYDFKAVLLGDSIAQGIWDAQDDSSAMDLDVAFAIDASAYVETAEEGTNGDTAEDLRDAIDTILSGHSVEAYPTYFIGYIGTNNVTQTRPYFDPNGNAANLIDGFADDLDYIFNAITTAGHKMFFGQIPFYDRPLPDPETGDKDGTCVRFQYLGSRPYNENIITPWLAENTPEYCHADGMPYLQNYELTYDSDIISDDGIHPSFAGYQTYYRYMTNVVGNVLKNNTAPTQLDEIPNVWVPSDSQYITLWLEANDDTTNGTSLTDWDGMDGINGGTASGTDIPTYGTTSFDGVIGGVRFESDDALTLNESISFSRQMIISLLKVDNTADAKTISGGGNNAIHFQVNPDEKLRVTQQAVTQRAISAASLAIDTPVLAGLQITKSNGGVDLLINGEVDGTYTGSAGFSASTNIIGNTSVKNIGLRGTINTFIIASIESNDLRQATEGYIAHKTGYTALLPISHPYKSAPPTINTRANFIADGNSITQHIEANSWPTRVAQDVRALGITMQNVSVSGQTTTDMSSDAATQIDSQLSQTRPNVLAALEIRNELFFQDVTSRIAVDRFWAYCDARRSAGWTVIAMIPFDSQITGTTSFGLTAAQFSTRISEARALMLAEWDDHADSVVDLRLRDELSDATDTDYFSDGTHPTALGQSIIADVMTPVIVAAGNGTPINVL